MFSLLVFGIYTSPAKSQTSNLLFNTCLPKGSDFLATLYSNKTFYDAQIAQHKQDQHTWLYYWAGSLITGVTLSVGCKCRAVRNINTHLSFTALKGLTGSLV